jgi:hypothetical protein
MHEPRIMITYVHYKTGKNLVKSMYNMEISSILADIEVFLRNAELLQDNETIVISSNLESISDE